MSKHEKKKSPGKALRYIGSTMLAISISISFVLAYEQSYFSVHVENVFFICETFMFPIGAFLLYRGKQINLREKAKEIRSDPRPPVVYLRPFKKDASMIKQIFGGVDKITSSEEQLAEAVEPIGPMIAIGEPGEKLPKPGAIRVYSDDDEWQKVVQDWLSKARLVILKPGISEGLWWELEQAVASIDPERFLILMHDVEWKDYEPFVKRLNNSFSIELPDYGDICSWGKSCFLQFDSDWKPQSIPFIDPPFWRESRFNVLTRILNHTMQPIFERLGVEWEPSPVVHFKVFIFGLLGLFLMLIFFKFIGKLLS